MQKYAKIKEDGSLEYAPRDIPGVSNWIEDTAAVLAAGYLPLAEVEMPEGQYIANYQAEKRQIVPIFADIPVPDYTELRHQAYPDFREYLDAQVKINSGDEALVAAGQTQQMAYFKACLAVKEKYPKPIETNNQGEAENA